MSHTWKVLLFAHLRERHGESAMVDAEPTVRAVLEALATQGITTQSCRLAADHQFCKLDDALTPGSELALIPPVSGG